MVYSRLFPTLLIAALAGGASWPLHAQDADSIRWESPAQFRQLLKKTIPGTLVLDNDAIEFKSPSFSQRWAYGEIKTFDLTENRELVITDYENRRWHGPGERTFRFTLDNPIPAGIANRFATRVERPVINGIPLPATSALVTLPAHQRAKFGGNNGALKFRDDGIDYVATDGRSSRTWRWSDIQTISHSNPWEFRITGYREIVEFDLKQPMPHDLFDRLWNSLYASDLNLLPGKAIQR